MKDLNYFGIFHAPKAIFTNNINGKEVIFVKMFCYFDIKYYFCNVFSEKRLL